SAVFAGSFMGSKIAAKAVEKPKANFGVQVAWVVLFVATMMIYAPVRNYDFINYDDNTFVYENPHVTSGFTEEGLSWAFTKADIDYYRPLSWVTHMLDVELYGLKAGGHHVTNVIFHALATCMLFVLLNRMTRRYWESLIVAALFAWHPLHVESVAWIAERKDVLCGFFWFSTIYLYVIYTEKPGGGRFAWVFIVFLLGLMSKPMIITLPFQLLLLDVWPLKRIDLGVTWANKAAALRELWQRLRWPIVEKLPIFGVVFISCAATFTSQKEVGTMSSLNMLPVERRLQNIPSAYGHYLQKSVYPAKLAVFYPLQVKVDWTRFAMGIVLLVGGTVFVLLRLRAQPFLAVGWFWFLGTLVPVIGIIQVGGQSHADRYTYIALVGLLIAAVWSVSEWVRRDEKSRAQIGVWAGVIVVLLCVIGTRKQLPRWQDGRTMFRHALKVTQDNYIAYYNLAQYSLRKGEFRDAVDLLREANRILPNTHDVLLNLGTALHDGRISLPEAYECYLGAAKAAPSSPQPHNNLGNVLVDMGRPTEAIAHYQQALELAPDHFATLYNYAGTLADLKRFEEAAKLYEAALALQPRDLDVRTGLINALSRSGQASDATGLAVETADLFPEEFGAVYNAAVLLQLAGHDSHAVRYYEHSLRLNPGYGTAVLEMLRMQRSRIRRKRFRC
ncbi:MAG: tetratricopeptide repeat protein, partial [Limisphaerales bacterium]